VHYIPLHRLPYYCALLGDVSEALPHAEHYYLGALSLPMFPGLEDEDVDRVVATLRAAL